MTLEEFQKTMWHHGNKVRLTNGKEYSVKVYLHTHLILWSDEYKKSFCASPEIIDCMTCDIRIPRPREIKKMELEKAKSMEKPKRVRQRIKVPMKRYEHVKVRY